MPTVSSGTQRRSSSDAGLDLERDVGRPLRLVPAANAVGERRAAPRAAAAPARRRRAPARRRRARAPTCARPRRRLALDLRDDAHREHPLDGDDEDRDAPTASSSGSSRQTSFAGTSACTATIPGSASGSTLGEREPITSQISSSARLGRVQHQVAVRARLDDGAHHRDELARRRRRACRSARPAEEKSVPSERRPFVRSVFPDETRSTIPSASPSRGAISTEPVTSTSSTSTGSSSRVSRG